MRAILLKSYESASLSVEDVPTPRPARGQVLIKMAAASINPSDLVFLRNQYGVKKELPVIPGFEGSGTVVEANAGVYGRWLLGKRVACKAPDDGDGTWAEYMTGQARSVIPLIEDVTLEQGASLIVNPLTAWALLSFAKAGGHTGFVQTAAASALGRMMERLARRWGLRSINIVRRREQVEVMKAARAVHVLDSSQAGWDEQLKILCATHHIRLAFDAVGGALTAPILSAMPNGSKMIVYGALSGENCQMNPGDLIFKNKTIGGFWLTEWIKSISVWKKIKMAAGVQKLLTSDLSTHIQARFPLDQFPAALKLYKGNRTEGKVLLIP